MQAVVSTFANPSAFLPFATPRKSASDHEGLRIRHAAADLFRQGRLAEADSMTRSALLLHPHSEDVLVIRALICEVQHDWTQAAAALERLLALQGDDAPVASWCHWIRVLRCLGNLPKAYETVSRALQLHPANPQLTHELVPLQALSTCGAQLAA